VNIVATIGFFILGAVFLYVSFSLFGAQGREPSRLYRLAAIGAGVVFILCGLGRIFSML
jgi:hypothetical protein